MKRVLIDSKDNIKYEGANAKRLLEVLNKKPDKVTAEDEMEFEHQLRTIKWTGQLRFEVHFDVKFEGINDWYIPVFKDVDSNLRFGSTNKLFTWDEWQKGGLAYFKENPNMFEYLGTSFDCESNGGTSPYWKFNIIE